MGTPYPSSTLPSMRVSPLWLLSLTLLYCPIVISSRKPGSCSSLINDKNGWSGTWQGKLRIPLTADMRKYKISLKTDRPVTSLTFWEGTLTGSDTSFSLKSPSYFRGKTGEILEHGFQLQYSGSVEPVFTSIKLNGVELCGGGGPAPTPASTAGPIPTRPTRPAPAVTTAGPSGPIVGPGQCVLENHDYGEVFRLSLLFYEAQRSGDLPEDNRIPWRGDSSLGDSGNGGEDLTGGYHDAGDYVKFGFPMAGAMTILAYGGISYASAYEASGQMEYLKDAIKWGTDYMIKAHASAEEFYCQVGNGDIDHAYPGRPETMSVSRPAYILTSSKPGSDCAAESAAALASASILFASSDLSYSAELLDHAEELFAFADKYRGIYSQSIPDAAKFYSSSNFEDELIWAAAWLYRATNDTNYLTKAEDMYASRSQTWTPWSFDWDNKMAGVQLLLWELTKKNSYKQDVKQFCDEAMVIQRSPGGQTFRAKWGSNRYASNFAFICLGAAEAGIQTESYTEYAASQVDYMLGTNPSGFSYVVGYGDKYPKQPP